MTDPSPSKILLVYDGSSVADRALEAAIDRARTLDASVTVLGLVPPRLWRARQGQFVVPPDKHDEEFAHDQIRRARRALAEAGVRAEGRVRAGPPATIISEEAAKGYALVVVASRPTATGAPSLATLLSVPDGCELLAVP